MLTATLSQSIFILSGCDTAQIGLHSRGQPPLLIRSAALAVDHHPDSCGVRCHVVVSTHVYSCIMHLSVDNGLPYGISNAAHPLMTDAANVSDTLLARMSDDEVALMYHVGMYGS